MRSHLINSCGSSQAPGRTAVILLLLAGLVVVALLIAPLLLNTQAFTDFILHEFEQRSGHRVTTIAMRVRLFPTIGLELSEVQVLERSSHAPVFSAVRLEIALQMLPLLGGRVVGKYLVIECPRATVRRDETGHWTVGPGKPPGPHDEGDKPFALLQFVRHILVTDGVVLLEDDPERTQRAPLQLTALHATVSEEIPGRTARIQISGEIPQGADRAIFNLEGSLIQSPGDPSTEPPRVAIPVQVEAAIHVHRLNLPYMAVWLGLEPVSDGLFGPAKLTAHMRLVPRSTGYDLILSEWRAGLLDISVQGTGNLTGLGTETPSFSTTLTAQPVALKQVINQIPSTWMSAQLRAMLTDQGVDGIITIQECHVTGRLKDGLHVNVRGEMEVRDGRFLPGRYHAAVRDLSAKISYDPEQIRIASLRANYGPVRLSEGAILITDWRREPLADVRISGEVPAAGLVALLNDGVTFQPAEESLSQLEQVTGEIQVGAHLTGRPTLGGGMSLVDADVTLHSVGFRHTALPVPVRQIHGRLNVSSTEIRVNSLHGQVGPVRMEAGGRVTLSGKPAFQDITLKGMGDGEDLAPWLQQAGSEQYRPNVEGPILLSAAVTGHIGTPRFKGTLTLDGASVEIPKVFAKAKGAPAGIRFDGKLSESRVISVRRGELVVPPVRLTGEGRIRLNDELDFQAKIISDALSLDKLPRGVTLGPIRAGILKAGLTMEGRAKDRASWVTSGLVHFNKGLIKGEQFQNPIRGLTMGLRFDGKNIDIRRLVFNIGDSDIRVSGSITDWMNEPRAKLVVESSQIDVRSLWPIRTTPASSSESSPDLGAWWAKGRVEATLLVDYVYYERFLLTGLSCRVRFEQGSLTIDRISGDTNEGHLGGRLVVNMPERGARSMRSTFRASGMPVERLSSLVEERPLVSGWMTAAGRIQGEFEGSHLLPASINSRRPISILIEDGRIFNLPVLSKLLSIMNLPALLEGKIDLSKEGMPLDRLKAVFSVDDGIIKVKEFLLDSPILKISGTGRYDYIADQFDAVLVTSPLGQYSALLKSIPLFGKLFTGNRQGFDTAIFELKGPAKDPSVVYMPAESLMAGVKGTAQLAVDLLVNAITLPKEAYSMAEDLFVDDEETQGGKSSEF